MNQDELRKERWKQNYIYKYDLQDSNHNNLNDKIAEEAWQKQHYPKRRLKYGS